MISVIYFDLGGVTFYDFFSGGQHEMAEYLGISVGRTHEAYVKTDVPDYSVGKVSDRERWQLFAEELKLDPGKVDPLIQLFFNSYKVIEPTVRLIRHLRENFPDLKRGILSDQPSSVVNLLRSRHEDVLSLFHEDLVLISAEIGLSKRDADLSVFRLALERSKVPGNEILYVDDSQTHLANAEKVGISGFHFDIIRQRPAELVKQVKQQIILS